MTLYLVGRETKHFSRNSKVLYHTSFIKPIYVHLLYITIKHTAVHEVYKHDLIYKVAANIQNFNHILREIYIYIY